MSNVTLDDIANDVTGEFKGSELGVESQEMEQVQQPSRVNEMISKVLTSETGDGSIDDYLDHPMNFKKSKGIAQILRGVTGIGLNLRLAIIDIGFGALRFSKERTNINDVPRGSGFPS